VKKEQPLANAADYYFAAQCDLTILTPAKPGTMDQNEN
jgi:hypothetical protein